jgi:hypothetical protein
MVTRNWLLPLLVTLLILTMAGATRSQRIFLWQADNNLRVTDPVFNATITSTMALSRTLDEMNVVYDRDRILPEDLSGYDVVMISLSFTCPG